MLKIMGKWTYRGKNGGLYAVCLTRGPVNQVKIHISNMGLKQQHRTAEMAEKCKYNYKTLTATWLSPQQ